jgi:hypothetical protein
MTLSLPQLRSELILLLLCLLYLPTAQAQSNTTRKWGHTDLDSLVSVSTPYRGEPGHNPEAPWFSIFTAPGRYNRFVMVRVDLVGMARANPRKAGDGGMTIDIDKFFRRITKTDFLQFSKAKLGREYAVSLPTAPNGSALHRSYSGFDNISEEIATMEVTWFERAQVIYMFFCTTVAPDETTALEEKQRYFSSISVYQQ